MIKKTIKKLNKLLRRNFRKNKKTLKKDYFIGGNNIDIQTIIENALKNYNSEIDENKIVINNWDDNNKTHYISMNDERDKHKRPHIHYNNMFAGFPTGKTDHINNKMSNGNIIEKINEWKNSLNIEGKKSNSRKPLGVLSQTRRNITQKRSKSKTVKNVSALSKNRAWLKLFDLIIEEINQYGNKTPRKPKSLRKSQSSKTPRTPQPPQTPQQSSRKSQPPQPQQILRTPQTLKKSNKNKKLLKRL